MPHKHTRRKGDDESHFNLAPYTIARPLSAFKQDVKGKTVPKQTDKVVKNASNNGYKHDDTPRAFARMMSLQASNKRERSGLDDGYSSRSKKKKQQKLDADDTTAAPPQIAEQVEIPRILPGERLGDYAARVDHALPVTGLARKGKVNIEGLKERQTKTEKRLQKMYASWREDEARLKDKEEERQEQEEEAEEERAVQYGGQTIDLPATTTGKGGRKNRRRMIGETAGGKDDDDPWAELKAKREQIRGLHDVVQAPPTFKAVPKEKFKVRDGAKVQVVNVPAKAGSLKRREELSDARKEVIERYRAMMKKGA